MPCSRAGRDMVLTTRRERPCRWRDRAGGVGAGVRDMDTKNRSGRRRSRIVRLAGVVATISLLAVSIGAATAAADGASGRHVATFTKYITEWPSMAGIVGGSVGDGDFSGTVLYYAPGDTTLITADYHFGGSRHDFTARMHVEQTGFHAVLVGVITDGWGKGKLVTGAYDQITCDLSGLATDCFQGWVDMGRPAGD